MQQVASLLRATEQDLPCDAADDMQRPQCDDATSAPPARETGKLDICDPHFSQFAISCLFGWKVFFPLIVALESTGKTSILPPFTMLGEDAARHPGLSYFKTALPATRNALRLGGAWRRTTKRPLSPASLDG